MTTSIRAAVPTTTTTTLKGRTKAIMRGSSSFSCNSTKLIRACMRRALSYSSSSSTARHVLETNSSSLKSRYSSRTMSKNDRNGTKNSYVNSKRRVVVVRQASSSTSTSSSSALNVATEKKVVFSGRKHSDLPKNFEHALVEEPLYRRWEQSGAFKPKANDEKEPFTVPMPPPNVTGALHMGHAMFVTIQDVMSRSMRMRGHPTLWLPGTDHAGIATQLVVERQLESEGLKRIEIGREEFEKRTWKWKKEYGDRIQNQIKRLGASCDWSRERFTLDDNLSQGVLEAFSRLHEQGLIYRGSYMVNWAPKLQTAVSDLEVEYSDEPGFLFHFKYPLEGYENDKSLFLPVATTRPETIVGDTAVAVHPEDPRYKDFVGKFCIVPGTNGRKIPVIADDYVDMEFGTGALKITPAHDPNDYEMGKKRNLEFINIMNKDGSMNANANAYAGLDRAECRKKIWEDLEKDGLAIKKEDYETRVPRSQRGGEVIEPMVSEQWFCKMETMSTPALNALKTGE